MLLQLLAFWHRLTIFMNIVWRKGIAAIRKLIGPAPTNYYLLQDGRVLLDTTLLPQEIAAETYLYNPETQKITTVAAPDPEGRFRRLNYLAASVTHHTIGNIDISEWLGEIRANPVPELNVKQIFLLWAAQHHRYMPLSNGVQFTITKSNGETDVITFE